MSNLESRVERLEQHTGIGKPEHKTWAVIKGEPVPDGVVDTDTVIWVNSEKAKQLTEEIIAGKGPNSGEAFSEP